MFSVMVTINRDTFETVQHHAVIPFKSHEISFLGDDRVTVPLPQDIISVMEFMRSPGDSDDSAFRRIIPYLKEKQ